MNKREAALARLPFAVGDTYEAIAVEGPFRHVEITGISPTGEVRFVIGGKAGERPIGQVVGIADAAYMIDKGFWRREFL